MYTFRYLVLCFDTLAWKHINRRVLTCKHIPKSSSQLFCFFYYLKMYLFFTCTFRKKIINFRIFFWKKKQYLFSPRLKLLPSFKQDYLSPQFSPSLHFLFIQFKCNLFKKATHLENQTNKKFNTHAGTKIDVDITQIKAIVFFCANSVGLWVSWINISLFSGGLILNSDETFSTK